MILFYSLSFRFLIVEELNFLRIFMMEAFETSASLKQKYNLTFDLCSTATCKASICWTIYATPPQVLYGGIVIIITFANLGNVVIDITTIVKHAVVVDKIGEIIIYKMVTRLSTYPITNFWGYIFENWTSMIFYEKILKIKEGLASQVADF